MKMYTTVESHYLELRYLMVSICQFFFCSLETLRYQCLLLQGHNLYTSLYTYLSLSSRQRSLYTTNFNNKNHGYFSTEYIFTFTFPYLLNIILQ